MTPEHPSDMPYRPSCGCPPPESIEALILRHSKVDSEILQKHLDTCPVCAGIAKEIALQIKALDAALQFAPAPVTACPGDETLACYLDGIQGERREEIETHLAQCPPCRKRLTELFRDLQWLLSDAPEPETANYRTETRNFAEEKEIIENNAKTAQEKNAQKQTLRHDETLPEAHSGGSKC